MLIKTIVDKSFEGAEKLERDELHIASIDYDDAFVKPLL